MCTTRAVSSENWLGPATPPLLQPLALALLLTLLTPFCIMHTKHPQDWPLTNNPLYICTGVRGSGLPSCRAFLKATMGCIKHTSITPPTAPIMVCSKGVTLDAALGWAAMFCLLLLLCCCAVVCVGGLSAPPLQKR
jgi:hypothetical protein